MTSIIFSADTGENKYDFTIYRVGKTLEDKYEVGVHYSGTMFKDEKPKESAYKVQILKESKGKEFNFVQTDNVPNDIYDCDEQLNTALLIHEMGL